MPRQLLFAISLLALSAGLSVTPARAETASPHGVAAVELVEISLLRETTANACAGGKTYTIAYSHSVSEAAFVRRLRGFADARAAELGCVEVMHDNTQANNLEAQINAVQGWITIGVDAIIVTPIDENALKPLQAQAQQKGIRWLTYVSPMAGADGFVGFDHAQSGQLIAQAAIDWTKANGITDAKALVTTLTGLPSVAPRWTEVERRFAEAGITIVAMQDSADQASGLTIAEAVLRQHPDLNIIIGLNDDAALGANRAIVMAGKDPAGLFVGGQDGSYEALVEIDKGGSYRASSALMVSDLGQNIVNLALNAINASGPSFAYTPTVLASKADQELLDQLLANFTD
ncbi:sugar ABC transporter substrate-binding protein [Rhodobacter sp. 24-YEA-8]|uniref:sugar ABC transporter substrate-binding protein n=1 Tax=Rhodobacter sp. 24-YEA-8 TaxID=1884310 RepID=UPI000897F142|nr:sugar ABC transporter substrate-binding protein [Rhodobacter sp. 24-YEA-8]SED63864.1 ABC-type sugar transport system, substrate-binding protein, contains N-terminal xre family HTH domain [Rhodobacter sp. 24-YEA-8]